MHYKSNFNNLRVGQKIRLKVVEVHPDWVIVSYNGQLLRVANKTNKKFPLNGNIELLVKKVAPIEFALPTGKGFSVWA